jgi:hypothetical protein
VASPGTKCSPTSASPPADQISCLLSLQTTTVERSDKVERVIDVMIPNREPNDPARIKTKPNSRMATKVRVGCRQRPVAIRKVARKRLKVMDGEKSRVGNSIEKVRVAVE